jgi:hypothetical protein
MTKMSGEILARWQARLDGADCTPLEFFDLVQASVAEKDLPGISFSYVNRREKGWLSARRIYLRIRYRRLFFDVSAFVAGDSLVVGWWLHEDLPGVADLFSELPVIGFIMEKTVRAASYFSVDFTEYLQHAVHESILRVVDELSEENGLILLPDEARIPVREEIW